MNFPLNKASLAIIAILLVRIPFACCRAAEAPKAAPLGIWCLLPADTIEKPALDRMQTSPVWTNGNIDGVVLRQRWDKLEPKEGEVDYTYFDRGLELAKKHNKRVQILVSAGRHSPKWVFAAGAQAFRFHAQGHVYEMPLPWEGLFQQKYGNLLRRLGERYGRAPHVAYVVMSGMGHEVESWFATSPEDMPAYIALGGNAKWLEGAKAVAALYAQAFPTTPFLLAMCPPTRDDDGRATLQKFVEDSIARYPNHFGLMADSLAPGDRPSSPKYSYQSVQRYSAQTTTGFQMLLPTRKLKGTLEQALTTAVALKAHFVEVYEPDCIDPNQQSVLAKARLALQGSR